jgi:hypothetical protein
LLRHDLGAGGHQALLPHFSSGRLPF